MAAVTPDPQSKLVVLNDADMDAVELSAPASAPADGTTSATTGSAADPTCLEHSKNVASCLRFLLAFPYT